MEKIAILIEVMHGRIKPANYGVITAARGHNRELYGFLLDGNAADHKASLQAYGIHKIINIASLDGPIEWNPASWSLAVINAIKHFGITILLGLTSSQGKDVLPRIAAVLDAPLVMDCIEIDLRAHLAKKSQYSGKTMATIKSSGQFAIYGIRPNAYAATSAFSEAELISFQTTIENNGLEVMTIKREASKGIDLSEADIIISGGRGMKNTKNFDILFECADTIGAAVGASRVAVDSEWVPYSMQVGQTGATVTPKVYIACGISGSVQHFAGMKTSGLIIAINKDPNAAIIQKCDYYIIADLFEIIPMLTRKLKEIAQVLRLKTDKSR
jgi:electron transfer flavoprotein alpha subunit